MWHDLSVALLVLCLLPAASEARHHKPPRKPSAPASGGFDYYVLSLSWSPEHCAEKPGGRGDSQCGIDRHYAFVLHGLWPQYGKGGYPQMCKTKNKLSAAAVSSMLDVMPSTTLIQHEWSRHGTCSGLTSDAYFGKARQAFESVTIPDRYQKPDQIFQVTAGGVRSDFTGANAGSADTSLAIVCAGHFLSEVQFCLTKDTLALRPCGHDVKDSCEGTVTVRPVR